MKQGDGGFWDSFGGRNSWYALAQWEREGIPRNPNAPRYVRVTAVWDSPMEWVGKRVVGEVQYPTPTEWKDVLLRATWEMRVGCIYVATTSEGRLTGPIVREMGRNLVKIQRTARWYRRGASYFSQKINPITSQSETTLA